MSEKNLVARTLRILNVLKGKTLSGLSNTEIAAATKIPAPTVTRILAVMVEENFCMQLDNGRYALSVRMLGIAQAHADELDRGQTRMAELKHGVLASARQ